MKAITTILLLLSLTGFGQKKIPLASSFAFVNQNARDDMQKIVNKNYGKGRYTIYNPMITPYQIIFDLEYGGIENAVVKELRWSFNTGNAANQNFFYVRKSDNQKILFYTLKQGNYTGDIQKYTSVLIPESLQAVASKIIFESNGWGDFPDWFEVWGDFTQKEIPLPTLARKPVDELFGAVAQVWDQGFHLYPEKFMAIKDLGVTRLRLYNGYDKTHDAAGNFIFNGYWKQIDNAKKLKAVGITTQFCYMDFPYYPFPQGVRTNTDTYLQLGKDIYQIGVMNRANSEPYQTIELGNELNNWYSSNPLATFMDGYAIAAMMSVAYDGHKGKYPNAGLKASGSTALLSCPGLATVNLDILYQIKEWSIANRGYRADGSVDFPFDQYSYHSYSSSGGQRSGTKGGIPPEIGMTPYMKACKDFFKRYAPWMKIAIGEWGWDEAKDSELNAPAYGKYTAGQTSGNWTARTLLGMAEEEIDAGSFFMVTTNYVSENLDTIHGDLFHTMALYLQKSYGSGQPDGTTTGLKIVRTAAGNYFKQQSDLLRGYTFKERISSAPDVIKFTKGPSEIYAIWEDENVVITDSRPVITERTGTYTLNVKGMLKKFSDDGVMITTDFQGGAITYGASPVFIVVPELKPLPVHEKPKPTRPVVKEKFNVKVYDFMGRLLMEDSNVEIDAFKEKLPKNKFLIIHYWNEKRSNTEKLFKLK